jgi:hypothetical protein
MPAALPRLMSVDRATARDAATARRAGKEGQENYGRQNFLG